MRVDFFFIQPHIFRAEGNVLIDGFLKQLIFRILENKANAESNIVRNLFRFKDVLSAKRHGPCTGLQKSVQMLYKGRFAGTCVPDNAHKLPGRDFHADILNGYSFKRGALAVYVA